MSTPASIAHVRGAAQAVVLQKKLERGACPAPTIGWIPGRVRSATTGRTEMSHAQTQVTKSLADIRPRRGSQETVAWRPCSRCGLFPARRAHPYCRRCAREYQRQWQALDVASPGAQYRKVARIAMRQLARRRKIAHRPCSRCGGVENLVFHHWDYSDPAAVESLCVGCHRVETYAMWLIAERGRARAGRSE